MSTVIVSAGSAMNSSHRRDSGVKLTEPIHPLLCALGHRGQAVGELAHDEAPYGQNYAWSWYGWSAAVRPSRAIPKGTSSLIRRCRLRLSVCFCSVR
jgi:hypothetical protein